MTDHETSRAAFLAWYEREADHPTLRTPEARLLAWRAWQANAAPASAVKLPEPFGYVRNRDAKFFHEIEGVPNFPANWTTVFTYAQVLSLLSSAGLVPAQDPKE